MSKVKEMDTAIKTLRSAAVAINEVADTLTEMFGCTPKEDPIKKELSLEEVRAVLADKSRKGHTAEIRELLQKYGATKLSAIDPANYEALLHDAEVLSDAE